MALLSSAFGIRRRLFEVLSQLSVDKNAPSQSAHAPSEAGRGVQLTMRPLKVLVIDDDPIAAEVARDRLERMGHTVFVRDSAIGTIGWIVSARPDVVLVDLNLPEIRGSDLARMVKNRMDLSGIVTILYTSATGKELDNAMRSTGGAGVISKSLNDELFGELFRRLVRGQFPE